ncbi:hypothetical protein Pelo_17646 [Pelomyxa schiedti]|nr:hypothetical protein Pelo_17646 [Pelomyxa schiedti]
MFLLPHKSWHVWTAKNIEKVKADEKKNEEQQEELRKRARLVENERLYESLKRRRAVSGSVVAPSAVVGDASATATDKTELGPANSAVAVEPEQAQPPPSSPTIRTLSSKSLPVVKEEHTEQSDSGDLNVNSNGGAANSNSETGTSCTTPTTTISTHAREPSEQRGKGDTEENATPKKKAPLIDFVASSSTPFMREDGHVNFFADLEELEAKGAKKGNPDYEKEKKEEKAKKDALVTTYLGATSAESMPPEKRPWYHHAQGQPVSETNKKKDTIHKLKDDPLVDMYKYVNAQKKSHHIAEVSSLHTEPVGPAHKSPPPKEETPKHLPKDHKKKSRMEKLREERLKREQAERRRAQALMSGRTEDDNDAREAASSGYSRQYTTFHGARAREHHITGE